jgi:hypothetical protein
MAKCMCGSDLERYELLDARGISCGYVCEECEDDKISRYRPDVFIDPHYWTEEPIYED